MDLYIIRHAWAEERSATRWPDDRLRPLTDDGRERFARLVRKLLKRGVIATLIATSPMVRCVQTAEILAQRWKVGEIVERDELLPQGDLESLTRWTAEQSREHQSIAWVGHAPDVGELVARLIGGDDAAIEMAKGAVAAIEFTDEPYPGRGALRWLATAKLLGC